MFNGAGPARSNARLEPLFDRFITVQVAVGLRFPAGGGAKGHHFAVAVSEADVERRHGAVRQAVVVVVAHAPPFSVGRVAIGAPKSRLTERLSAPT